MEPEILVFNGVDGETGDYLRKPVRLDRLAARRRRRRWRRAIAGVDTRSLSEAGWGILFAPDAEPAAREGLGRLLRHRQAQAGGCYREYICHPGETGAAFLARHGRRFGPADPEIVPYYLLIAGSPEAIPFEFQYQLDVQYAVGRLWFDSAAEYEAYARGVVEAESRPAPPSREVVFFAPQHPDDPMTRLSAEQLARPLAGKLAGKVSGWTVTTRLGEEADKRRLASLLGGEETPALLFTASHGVGLPQGHARQQELQGALLCQGWPGPRARSLSEDHYFAARDVSADASPGGLVSFHFACYSAGTPRWDSFSHLETGALKALAQRAFVARLPQRLLSHPRGGALAVIGHVDQAWPCSFLWEDTGAQHQAFVSVLTELMQGYRIGAAMEYFGQRYAEIAAELSLRLEPVRGGERADGLDLVKLWLANNDARSYVLLGDPAVRLPPPSERRSEIQSASESR
jgi:hypothetical protein